MAVKIAELEIDIRDNGSSAVLALNAVANALSKLATNTAPATKQLQNTTKELKTVDKAASSAAKGGLGKFFHSIVRIAGYRAIRSALKMITSSFKEGVQNIALYSQAIGGLDASKANETMSAYASMGAQIKNSLGAAVMPLLANLMPMIQKVADAFMDLTEVVAKFFATLNGQATYTAANRDYWVDYAKGLEKSTGAAKELKRTILGFDEINALQKQSGGGSGSSAVDYSSMFVEKTNDYLPLKQTFEDALQIAKWIGIAVAGWKLSSAFINGITALTQLSKAKSIILGITLAIVGITLSYNAGIDLANGNIGAGIAEGLGGALATALGGAFIGKAIGGMFSVAGGGLGAVIGLGIGLVASIMSLEIAYAAQMSKNRAKEILSHHLEGTGLTVDSFSDDAIQTHIDVANTIRTKTKEITGLADPFVLAKLNYARELIQDIFSLDGIEIKSPEQVQELKGLVEALDNLGLDGIKVEFDELTGKIKTSRVELEKHIDKLEEEIKTAALMQAAIDSYYNLITAQQELNELYAKRKALAASLEEALKKADFGAASVLQEKLDGINEAIKTQEYNVKTLDGRWESFLRKATGATDDWKKSVDGVSKAIGGITFPTVSNGKFSVSGFDVTTRASGGLVPTGDLFWAGERAPELIMSAPNGSEVVNMSQFQDAMMQAVMMAGGNGGGDWTIVVQDESGNIRSSQVITAAERANRRDGRTIIPVGVQ